MTQYDRTNTGVLFDNNRKESEKHPDMNGTLNINGVEHWFSGWWKQGQNGDFLSLSIGKPKDQQAAPPPRPAAVEPVRRGNRPSNAPAPRAAAPAASGSGWDDEDVPFIDPLHHRAYCLAI